MKLSCKPALLILLLLPVLCGAAGPEKDVQKALDTQVEAWNRGDIPAFVETYAEDCTFVGKQILQGRAQLLERYRKTYPTPDAMGKLSFAHLKVRPLDRQVAIVTGEWNLARSGGGGGPVGGVFSLVLKLENGAWLIVLDHTTGS